MGAPKIQKQYDLIYSYFKTTTEPYDYLEWNGKNLAVMMNGEVIETYASDDLSKIIDGFVNL